MRSPVCHPDRSYLARDLCGPCYQQDYRVRNLEHIRAKSRNYQKIQRILNPEKYLRRKREHERRRRIRQPEHVRALGRWNKLKNRHGLTKTDFAGLQERQLGLCAICLSTLTNGSKTHVDHDHATGQVRGLLCKGCNQGIGLLKENVASLRRAADYLERAAKMQEANP